MFYLPDSLQLDPQRPEYKLSVLNVNYFASDGSDADAGADAGEGVGVGGGGGESESAGGGQEGANGEGGEGSGPAGSPGGANVGGFGPGNPGGGIAGNEGESSAGGTGVGSGPDVAGLAAAEASIGVGLSAAGHATDEHFGRAADAVSKGQLGLAATEIGLGLADAIGGRLGGMIGSGLGAPSGAAIGGMLGPIGGVIGGLIGGLVGLGYGTSAGKAAAHATHDGLGFGTIGADVNNEGMEGGLDLDWAIIDTYSRLITAYGVNKAQDMIFDYTNTYILNDGESKITVKARAKRNIIGSAHFKTAVALIL